ncbi:MAG: DUF1569 domain-containing protein [Rhodothermia bacterium]|nr:DUF1569 domain-containing protein [Rhodothermia bacterium]
MPLPNIFTREVTDQLLQRLNQLTPASQPQWGKMNATQMLAHCNVSYEMAYENKHPKPNALMRFFIQLFAKQTVVGETPYKRNLRTAPMFVIGDDRNFETEKNRMIDYLNKTVELGESYFDQKESLSFGKLSITEWNNLFYKHLDHHLTQFGV